MDELPNGWIKSNLLEIADYLNGLAMQKYRPNEGEIGIPVLKIKELRQGTCGLNQHLFKITSNTYDKWFYYAWTKHHLSKFVALAADMGTTMGHIKRGELAKSEVLIRSSEDFIRIGGMLQPIYDLIIANRLENRKFEALRDSLLPRLISGEIDVSDLDI